MHDYPYGPPWCHVHGQSCSSQRSTPMRRPTATRTASSSSLRPHAEMGYACSQCQLPTMRATCQQTIPLIRVGLMSPKNLEAMLIRSLIHAYLCLDLSGPSGAGRPYLPDQTPDTLSTYESEGQPTADLCNLSINKSLIPEQWKCSTITPVAKVARPTVCAEYRPISVTPIMSRLLEKVIAKDYIYPALIHPDCTHLFHDQFAFRLTGSTTAALVSLIHKISSLLVEYPYVHVIALDFSKFVDTVRHSTLLAKCADLPIEDAVYNSTCS